MERKLRDNIVSVHNACDRWINHVCQAAIAHVKTVADSRTLLADPEASKSVDAYFDEDERRATGMQAAEELSKSIAVLQGLLESIANCVQSTTNLEPIVHGKALQSLQSALPIMIEIQKMLSDNLKVWESIALDLCVSYDRNLLVTCLAAAVHLPFINERIMETHLQKLASLAG